jgi:cytochrome b561
MHGYGVVTKVLHWLLALCIIAMLLIGVLFSLFDWKYYFPSLMGVHKSLGVTIILLMFFRLLWRFINIQPAPIEKEHVIRNSISLWLHRLLYILVFLIAVVGWVMSSAGGHVTYFWWLFNVTLPIPLDRELVVFCHTTHLVLAWVLGVAICVHVIAALYHHCILKDTTLKRMC